MANTIAVLTILVVPTAILIVGIAKLARDIPNDTERQVAQDLGALNH